MKTIFYDGLVVAGAGLVAWGLWTWWPPAGLVSLGAMLIVAGLSLARYRGTK